MSFSKIDQEIMNYNIYHINIYCHLLFLKYLWKTYYSPVVVQLA